MVDRLSDDHRNAWILAEGLLQKGFGIDLTRVQTNIIHLDLEPTTIDAPTFCRRMDSRFVKVKPIGRHEVRMVTHKDIQNTNIKTVLDAAGAAVMPSVSVCES
jgi:threonine aldolase